LQRRRRSFRISRDQIERFSSPRRVAAAPRPFSAVRIACFRRFLADARSFAFVQGRPNFNPIVQFVPIVVKVVDFFQSSVCLAFDETVPRDAVLRRRDQAPNLRVLPDVSRFLVVFSDVLVSRRRRFFFNPRDS
jgi:hypothetical protein